MTEVSDLWIKPNDLLRNRKKAKRESLKPIPHNVPKPLVNQLEPRSTPRIYNPFRVGISSSKRKLELEESPCRDDLLKKQQVLLSLTPPITPKVSMKKDYSALIYDESANLGAEDLNQKEGSSPTTHQLDWSVKVKIRFTSTKPYAWKSNLRSSEEASGTTSFVRCLHNASETINDCIIDTSPATKLYQHSLLWTFPKLPWVPTFPRIFPAKAHGRLNKIRSVFVDNQHLQDSMFAQWCDSLRSLYQLVKCQQCPYFYICSSTFTALFRASGVAGFLGPHILVTPTTSVFRQALKDEDIEFSMPLRKDSNQNELESMSSPVESSAESKESEEETMLPEDASAWLESMGLSSLSNIDTKKWSYKTYGLDAKQESLILIDGNNAQTFVSFLLNKNSTFERTGPLAGVPPTLLSPTAFVGGSLEPLKIRQAVTAAKEHIVEIKGPILPSTVENFNCLMTETLGKGNYTIQDWKYQPTIPFSDISNKTSSGNSSSFAFASSNLKSTGLDPAILPKFC